MKSFKSLFTLLGLSALMLLAGWYAQPQAREAAQDGIGGVRVADLPPEARQTLALIKQGGPFPYARDGTVFHNREGLLPRAPRGTYREYTVKTPGPKDRGGAGSRYSQSWCGDGAKGAASTNAEPGAKAPPPQTCAPPTSRGARRIVVSNHTQFYYTEDHYRSFRRILE